MIEKNLMKFYYLKKTAIYSQLNMKDITDVHYVITGMGKESVKILKEEI